MKLGYLPNNTTVRLTHPAPPPPPPSSGRWKGLGDAVHAVLKAVGVVGLVERRTAQTGKPCGCAARREALNQAVPFGDSAAKR
jgi:hypothetical protein